MLSEYHSIASQLVDSYETIQDMRQRTLLDPDDAFNKDEVTYLVDFFQLHDRWHTSAEILTTLASIDSGQHIEVDDVPVTASYLAFLHTMNGLDSKTRLHYEESVRATGTVFDIFQTLLTMQPYINRQKVKRPIVSSVAHDGGIEVDMNSRRHIPEGKVVPKGDNPHRII